MKFVQQSLEYHRAVDSEQVTQRIKMGDQLERAREIDHTAYFRKRRDAEDAATELREDGYRVTIGRRGLGAMLEAHTESDIEQDTVDRFVEHVYELVARHDGVYDGWGGPVVLKESK